MKSKIYILLAVGILMFSAADVSAQVKGGSFSITPFAGYSVFDDLGKFENTATYGLALGYNFSERFSLEATYNILDTEIVPEGITASGGGGGGFPPPPPGQFPPDFGGGGEEVKVIEGGADVDAYQYALELLFYIYPGKKFAPYGVIGIGMTEFEYLQLEPEDEENNEPEYIFTQTKRDHNAPMGFGFKYFVTDTIAVRGDFRAVFPFDQNNMRATVGVTFQFGGE